MTTRTIRIGERGVDFSYSKPPAANIIANGYTFVVGYVSYTSGKNLSKTLCQQYLDAGLAVLLVWETSQTAANGGRAVGLVHGAEAARQAKTLGYPPDVALIAAVDTGPTNLPAQEAYLRAFAEASYYPLGVYGGTTVMEKVLDLNPLLWVCVAAYTWSGIPPNTPGGVAKAVAKAKAIGAHAIQRSSYSLDGKWPVDPNEVLASMKAWSLAPDPQPLSDEEERMYRSNAQTMVIEGVAYDPGKVWFELMPGGQIRHVEDINEVVVALGGTADSVVLDTSVRRPNAALLALAPYVPPTGSPSPSPAPFPVFDVDLALDLNGQRALGTAVPR